LLRGFLADRFEFHQSRSDHGGHDDGEGAANQCKRAYSDQHSRCERVLAGSTEIRGDSRRDEKKNRRTGLSIKVRETGSEPQ